MKKRSHHFYLQYNSYWEEYEVYISPRHKERLGCLCRQEVEKIIGKGYRDDKTHVFTMASVSLPASKKKEAKGAK